MTVSGPEEGHNLFNGYSHELEKGQDTDGNEHFSQSSSIGRQIRDCAINWSHGSRLSIRRSLLPIVVGFTTLLIILKALLGPASVNYGWTGRIAAPRRIAVYKPAILNAPYSSPAYAQHRVYRPLVNATDKSSFRQNLMAGERYITAQNYLGFNNQFQSIMHLLYLALKTERVAVLPPMQPIHIDPPSFTRWSDFFDMEALQKATGVAILEWQDLKDSVLDNPHVQPEQVACWSSREASHNPPRKGRYQGNEDWTFGFLGLTPILWPLPMHIRGMDTGYIALDKLIAFDSDAWWKQQWTEQVKKRGMPQNARVVPPTDSLEPDDQFLCYDDTFYLMSSTHHVTPAYPHIMIGPQQYYHHIGIADAEMAGWNTIGQFMHWRPHVLAEAAAMLRFTMGLDKRAKVPPYIAVHIRHGDVGSSRQIEIYAEKVVWVRKQLNEGEKSPIKGKAHLLPIICSSDDTSAEFINGIKEQGWFLMDHDAFGTIERHGLVGDGRDGGWWPTITSSAILGGAQGIVGSHWSTFSIYAWIRVLTWQTGGIGTEAG